MLFITLRRVESKVVSYVRNERARQALLSANELLDAISTPDTVKKGLMNDPIPSPSTLIQPLMFFANVNMKVKPSHIYSF